MSHVDEKKKDGFKNSRRAPRYHAPRPHYWTGDQKQIFAEWINQRQMDNESQMFRLQTRQNRVVLEILDAEARHKGGVNSAFNSHLPVVESPKAKRLLRIWDELDRQIRCLKHIERLLSPIYFQAAVNDEPNFLSNDPITLFFWEQCKLDNPTIKALFEEVTV